MNWRHLRFVLAIVVASLSAACSHQNQDLVFIGKGGEERQKDWAKDYAAYFLPYAMLSHLAYQDLPPQHQRTGCPETGAGACASLLPAMESKKLNTNALIDDTYSVDATKGTPLSTVDAMGRAKSILKDWTLLGAYQIFDTTPIEEVCRSSSRWCLPFSGLEVQAWGIRGQLVIAFRGSDPTEGDWLTNLRWFTRIIPGGYDQYDQVRDHIDTWITEAVDAYATVFKDPSAKDCAKGPPANCPLDMIATGHSLGGGLAQQAAYASKGRIRHAITFDPSPVTGFYSVDEADRQTAEVGLVVDRVYEHGEFLAYARLFMREIYPVSGSDPAIYQIRFNKATKGSIFAQHSVKGLIAGYIALADTQVGPGLPARPRRISVPQ